MAKTFTVKYEVGDIVYIMHDAKRGKMSKAKITEVIVNVTPKAIIIRYCVDSLLVQRNTRWLESQLLTETEAKVLASDKLKKKVSQMQLVIDEFDS